MARRWRPRFGCRVRGHSWLDLPSVDLTVEMAIHLAGRAEVLPLIADPNWVHHPGIQFQLDLEPPQSEVDLVEIVVDAHGSVFTHDSVDAGVEEPVQVQ